MSILSQEIGRWIGTNPGMFKGDEEERVWDQAVTAFVMARRWKQPVPRNEFKSHVNGAGYRIETRSLPTMFFALVFPEQHRGF